MSSIIFYFSGTGNSLAVSNSIAEKLGETKVSHIMDVGNYDLRNYDYVGFIFPVYYAHAPEIVVRVLNNIRLEKFQKVFIVAVYGGTLGYAVSDVRTVLNKNDNITDTIAAIQ